MLRSAIASLGGSSSARRTVAVSPISQTHFRNFQTSGPALKKRKAVESQEEIDAEEEETDDLSLFDDAEASTSRGTLVDRKTQRENIKRSILSAVAVKGQERRDSMTAMRVGSLRKVVQLSESAEEVEELKGVLRSWRVLGGKVTKQTAQEIVGRCCNLGRPDLAKELSEDRIQYGIPTVTPHSQKKLEAALATFIPASSAEAPSS